jgi:hypothetical protein
MTGKIYHGVIICGLAGRRHTFCISVDAQNGTISKCLSPKASLFSETDIPHCVIIIATIYCYSSKVTAIVIILSLLKTASVA